MEKKILYVGLEVDDQAFHAGILAEDSAEVRTIRMLPDAGILKRELQFYIDQGFEIRVCYEATYLGFSVQRKLQELGIACEVIAPTLIPQSAGPKVKNDRLDCIKLAKYYKGGLLTPVSIPTEEDEAVRDLIRTRHFLVKEQNSIKRHVIMLCRRLGEDYRKDVAKKGAAHWSAQHFEWIESVTAKKKNSVSHLNLKLLLVTLRQLQNQIGAYSDAIQQLSESVKYSRKVSALRCYRGIDTISAMALISEIGDVRRFSHPRKLASYAGFDIAEYSSGGKERRFQITKMGSAHIRTALIEACQSAPNRPRIHRKLMERRKEIDPTLIEIADRCMTRIYKKSARLVSKGKHRNKAITAAAREMTGFIWESLRAVAA